METGSGFPPQHQEQQPGHEEQMHPRPQDTMKNYRGAGKLQDVAGNVASALGGAAGMLAAGRPELAGTTRTLLSTLLRAEPLRGAASLDGAGRLHLRSCCLIYRTAGAARPENLCGDCVLSARP